MAKYSGVDGGTPKGEPLCRTCRNAMYVRGKAESQLIVICSGVYNRPLKLQWEAIECGEYDDKRKVYKSDLEKIAWIINPNATGKIGFTKPGTPEHRKLIDDL